MNLKTRKRLAFASLMLLLAAIAYYARAIEVLAAILVCEETATSARNVLLWDQSPIASQVASEKIANGIADAVIILDCPLSRLQRLRILPSDAEQTRVELMKAGVSDGQLHLLTCVSRDSYGKCEALIAWLDAHPSEHVIILCELFRTRNIRWYVDRQLCCSDARRVRIQSWCNHGVSTHRWWHSEDAVTGVIGGWISLMHFMLAGPVKEDVYECNPEQFEPVRI